MQIPRLRQWREFRGLTQKDLAAESGVSVRSIAGYEAGAGIRPNTARKLAEALNIEVADFFREPESPKVSAPSSQQLTLNGELEEERRRAERERLIDKLPGWIRAAAEDPEFVRRFEAAKRSPEEADRLAAEERAAEEEASRRVRDLKDQEAPAGDVQRVRRDLQRAKARHRTATFLAVDVWRGKDVSDKRAVEYAAELAASWRALREGEFFDVEAADAGAADAEAG